MKKARRDEACNMLFTRWFASRRLNFCWNTHRLLSIFVLCREWVHTQQHRGNVTSFILFLQQNKLKEERTKSAICYFLLSLKKVMNFWKMKNNRFHLSYAGRSRKFWTTNNWQGCLMSGGILSKLSKNVSVATLNNLWHLCSTSTTNRKYILNVYYWHMNNELVQFQVSCE